MRPFRILGGSLFWILAGVVGLLGGLLTITVVLAPLGVPLLFLARRLFRYAMRFFVPHGLRHPAQAVGGSVRDGARKATPDVSAPDLKLQKRAKKARKRVKRRRRKMRRQLADGVLDRLGL